MSYFYATTISTIYVNMLLYVRLVMRQEMTSAATGSGDLTTCSLCGAEISNGKCTKCGDTYSSHTADGRSTKTKPQGAAGEYEEKSRWIGIRYTWKTFPTSPLLSG
jgi:hypothetical protein